MSHSIHMLSIQIDTKNPGLIIHHQFNNIKLSFFANQIRQNFTSCNMYEIETRKHSLMKINGDN